MCIQRHMTYEPLSDIVFVGVLSTYFSYIVEVSFVSGGNWSTRGKTPTCRKSLINFTVEWDVTNYNKQMHYSIILSTGNRVENINFNLFMNVI